MGLENLGQDALKGVQSFLTGAPIAAGALGLGSAGINALEENVLKKLDGPVDDAINGFRNWVEDGNKAKPTQQKYSLQAKALNVGGLDPIQGYDVGVWVEDKGIDSQQVLLGQFTSILITVKNASEAYLPVGSRQPIYFDGEIQIAFNLEKGLLDSQVFEQTFGFRALDYNNRYFRSPRFKITFAMDPVDFMMLNNPTASLDNHDLNSSPTLHQRSSSGRIVLDNCKIDVWHLGAKSGKEVVATHWSGVAQQIYSYSNTVEELPIGKTPADAYKADGSPKHLGKAYTFNYAPAQVATTDALQSQKSYDDTSNMSQSQILEMTLNAYRSILNSSTNSTYREAVQALITSTEKQLRSIKGANSPEGKSRNDGQIPNLPIEPKSAAIDNIKLLQNLNEELTRLNRDESENKTAINNTIQLIQNIYKQLLTTNAPEPKSTNDGMGNYTDRLIAFLTQRLNQAKLTGTALQQEQAQKSLDLALKALTSPTSFSDKKFYVDKVEETSFSDKKSYVDKFNTEKENSKWDYRNSEDLLYGQQTRLKEKLQTTTDKTEKDKIQEQLNRVNKAISMYKPKDSLSDKKSYVDKLGKTSIDTNTASYIDNFEKEKQSKNDKKSYIDTLGETSIDTNTAPYIDKLGKTSLNDKKSYIDDFEKEKRSKNDKSI